MTFIKYTHDGRAVIQPAALMLSDLIEEETLEMHPLKQAIVLLKRDMTPQEKVDTMCSLTRLVNSLSADMMCGFDEAIDNEEADEDDEGKLTVCGDEFPIPVEVFEDAGIWGNGLHIQSVDGAVIITAGKEQADE